MELPVGKYKVQMKKKGYASAASEITIKAGETSDLELSLAKLPDGVSEDPNVGWISISGSPKKSEITIKGKKYTSPLKYHELKKGNYSFKAKRDGYKSQSISFKITAQKHIKEQFMLNPIDGKRARRLALVFPGLGHMYAEQQSKGILFMGLEAVALFGTLSMTMDYLSVVDEWNIAKADYLAETVPAEIARKFTIYENLDKDKKQKFISSAGMGSAALAVWIWNVYDINKSIPSVFDVGLNANGQLEVSVAF